MRRCMRAVCHGPPLITYVEEIFSQPAPRLEVLDRVRRTLVDGTVPHSKDAHALAVAEDKVVLHLRRVVRSVARGQTRLELARSIHYDAGQVSKGPRVMP